MNRVRCSLLASFAIAAPAAADLSMVEAISIAEGLVADRTLVQITLRDEKPPVWRAEFIDADLVDLAEVDLDAMTGEVVDQSFDPIEAEDRPLYEAIIANLDSFALTFAEGVEAAQDAAGAKAVPFDAEIDLEAGMLAYQVEFLPGDAKFYVDVVTGQVANHHGDDGNDDDVIDPATLLAGIDAAVALNGLPVLAAEGEDELGGDDNAASVVEVLQWNGETGQLVETVVDAMSGAILSNLAFTPSMQQLLRLQQVIDSLDLLTASFADALAAALAAHPGALGVHEIALEGEDAGVFYKVELVNSLGLEIDVFIAATGASTASSQAGVNFHPCDFNRDGRVDGSDLAELLAAWGTMNPGYDLDGDQMVSGFELGELLAGWL